MKNEFSNLSISLIKLFLLGNFFFFRRNGFDQFNTVFRYLSLPPPASRLISFADLKFSYINFLLKLLFISNLGSYLLVIRIGFSLWFSIGLIIDIREFDSNFFLFFAPVPDIVVRSGSLIATDRHVARKQFHFSLPKNKIFGTSEKSFLCWKSGGEGRGKERGEKEKFLYS